MVPTNRTSAPQTTGASASASTSTSASTNEEDGKEKEGNDAGVKKRKASASPSSPEETTNKEEQGEEQQPQQQQYPNPPSHKKQRSKRKKAKDEPKRPLSAYNFFFKYERLRILESLKKLSKNISTSASIDLSESEVDEAGLQDLPTQHHQQQRPLLQLSPEEQELLVKDGKVSFEEMGRMCGRRWKDVSPEERRIYEEHARIDAERYKREKREYNDRKNRVVFSNRPYHHFREQQHQQPFPDVTRQQNILGNETSYAPSSYHGQHLNYPQSYGHYPYQHHTRSFQDPVGDNSSSLVGHSSPTGYISSPSHHRYPHYHQYTPQPQFNAQTTSPVYNHLEYPNNPYPVISSSPPPRQYHQTISPTMTTPNNNNTSDISITQPLPLSPVTSHPPPYPPPTSSYTPYSYNTNQLQQQHQATENSNNNNEETTIHPGPLPPSSPVLSQHGHHFFANNSVHNHLDQEHQQYSQQRVLHHHHQQQYNNRQHAASYSSTPQAQWPHMSQQTSSSSTTGGLGVGDQEIKKEKDENSSFTF